MRAVTRSASTSTPSPFLADTGTGLRYLWGEPAVRAVALGYFAIVACNGIDDVALVFGDAAGTNATTRNAPVNYTFSNRLTQRAVRSFVTQTNGSANGRSAIAGSKSK